MKIRRIVATILLLAGIFCCTCSFAWGREREIHVNVNGTDIPFTDETGYPFISSENRTLVPLRAAGEAMGLTVEWDREKNAAVFKQEYDVESYAAGSYAALKCLSVYLYVGSAQYDIVRDYIYNDGDGRGEYTGSQVISKTMETAVLNWNGRTYAPIRYLAEAFHYDISWDAATQTVHIMDYQYYELPYALGYHQNGEIMDTLYAAFQLGETVESAQVAYFHVLNYLDAAGTAIPVNQLHTEIAPMTPQELAELEEATGTHVTFGFKTGASLSAANRYNIEIQVNVTKTNGAEETALLSFLTTPPVSQ